MLTISNRPRSCASRTRVRVKRLAFVVVVLSLMLLMAACDVDGAPAATPVPGASPTGTLTPAGDVLRIDGVPVRQVVIPSPDTGPVYALAGDRLFRMKNEAWIEIGIDRYVRRYLVDSEELDRIFRGRHRVCGSSPPEDDIPMEVSSDGGAHWRQLTLGSNIEPIMFDPTDHDVIYGADCSSLVITTNAGNTWNRIRALPGYSVVDVRMTGTRLLVLGVNPTGNSALTTVDVTDPHSPEVGDMLLIADGITRMDANHEQIVVAGGGIIHISVDGGQTWTQSVATIEEDSLETPGSDATPARMPLGNVLSLLIGAQGTIKRLYAGTPNGLLVSQDDGLTWVRYDEIPPDAIVTQIQYGLANADLYVTTNPGVVMVPAP
ncbi:MAG: hypothetical protein M9890_04880 [Thermomicrobiales bacterium]|nr:hypothetical protein [Thermomicrobiales bacterium]